MWDNLMFVSWSLSKQWEFCGSPANLEKPNVATIWQKWKESAVLSFVQDYELVALSFISDFIVRSTMLISGILMGLRIIIQNFVQFLTSAMPWFYTAILCYSRNPSWKRLSSSNMPRIVINDHHKPLDQYKDQITRPPVREVYILSSQLQLNSPFHIISPYFSLQVMKNLRVSLAWIGYGKPLRNDNKIQTPVGLGRALFGNGLLKSLLALWLWKWYTWCKGCHPPIIQGKSMYFLFFFN